MKIYLELNYYFYWEITFVDPQFDASQDIFCYDSNNGPRLLRTFLKETKGEVFVLRVGKNYGHNSLIEEVYVWLTLLLISAKGESF